MPESTPSVDARAGASLTLYNLLLPPGLLLSMPGFLIKMKRRGGYGPGFGQRFARYASDFPPPADEPSERPIWVHAVSVGEVLIAQKLIAELRRQAPDARIVLSTTTSTGHEIALRRVSRDVQVIYNPLDLPWIVNRAFDRIRPRALVLVEAEVWPNMVTRAVRENVPVLLVNARLSPRSERRYLKFRRLVAPVFGMLANVCVQEPEDVDRWAGLGVARERITHTGSIKFDQSGGDPTASPMVETFRALLRQLWGETVPRTVLLASSHSGEEVAVGKVILELRQRFPDLKYLVAPRHFERAAAVEHDLAAAGLKPCRRSLQPESPPDEGTPDTLIIDSTGELRAWQALPDLVVIGKSFLATGGQNPVEAISSGTAVVTGPRMENFAALMALLRKRGGVAQVEGIDMLGDALAGLLENPTRAGAMIHHARDALQEHSGATQKTATLILTAISTRLSASQPRG